MLDRLLILTPLVVTILITVGFLWASHWMLIKRHPDLGNERRFPRQLIMLGLTLLGLFIIVLALPVHENTRNQLLGLIGIVLSAMVAFSSTTIISNLMAGVLLRITKPFKVGEFIRIHEHFGRVSERGLFDTEIQTETSELIALPNLYLINHPVTTIRSTGTIISATLSLGYDVDRRTVEPLLLEAARKSGLTEPYVHLLELGNFAITYRVSGLLEDPKRIISARSSLNAWVLDTLHGHHVEIMSPTFMNQRRLTDDEKMIPAATIVAPTEEPESIAEDIAFDKAEQAEQLQKEKQTLLKEIEQLEETIKEGTSEQEKLRLTKRIEQVRERLKMLEKMVLGLSEQEEG